jgi:hypothetical protein
MWSHEEKPLIPQRSAQWYQQQALEEIQEKMQSPSQHPPFNTQTSSLRFSIYHLVEFKESKQAHLMCPRTIPGLESALESGTIFLGTQTMSSGLEVASNGAEGRKKPLRVFG